MASLLSLPRDVCCAITSWLYPPDIQRLALASKRCIDSPFHQLCFRRVFRIRVAPDTRRQAWLLDALLSQSLPSAFSLTAASQLTALATVRDIVASVRITSSSSNGLRGLDQLTLLHRLARLEWISDYGYTLDMSVVVHCVPQLQHLRVCGVDLANAEAIFTMRHLRNIQFDRVGIVADRDSAVDFTRGPPQLERFEVECVSGFVAVFAGVAQWRRPLKCIKLVEFRIPQQIVCAIQHVHLPTLESLELWDCDTQVQLSLSVSVRVSSPLRKLTTHTVNLVGGLDALDSLSQLQYLDLMPDCARDDYDVSLICQCAVDDVAPLASLQSLETLKIRLSRRATSCIPLRSLTRLRELCIMDGWLRDFVGSLSWLTTLTCTEATTKPYLHRTFQSPAPDRHCMATCATLRRASITVNHELNSYAFQLLRPIRDLCITMGNPSPATLDAIYQLPELTSLDMTTSSTFPDLEESGRLANVQRIEKLRLCYNHSPLLLCPWDLQGATQLRVVEIGCATQEVLESLAGWHCSLVRLEQLHLIHFEGEDLTPLLALSQLRVLTIDASVSCQILRNARGDADGGDDGALPHLTWIGHCDDGDDDGDQDCLGKDSCPYAMKEAA